MKRILRLALVLLALIAALSSQTWFSFGISSGGNLEVAGFEAYPFLSGTLLADFLAIALVLYLRKKWAAIFIAAAALGLVLTLVATLPGAFGFDLGVAAPIIEKATGVASWLAQLESIVISQNVSAFGGFSWALSLLLLLFHFWAIFEMLKRHKARVSKTSTARDGAVEKRDESPESLWNETSEPR